MNDMKFKELSLGDSEYFEIIRGVRLPGRR